MFVTNCYCKLKKKKRKHKSEEVTMSGVFCTDEPGRKVSALRKPASVICAN